MGATIRKCGFLLHGSSARRDIIESKGLRSDERESAACVDMPAKLRKAVV
jgi:hypothetical protein